MYWHTPRRILFPASVKNDNEQIFITWRELNDVKKCLIDGKIFCIVGDNWIKKINNWKERKGQSLWINATLEEQKEVNNSRHLCFLLTTLTLNDLLNFSINVIDDNKKQVDFKDNETKLSILNFKTDVFEMNRKLRPTKSANQIRDKLINFLLEYVQRI